MSKLWFGNKDKKDKWFRFGDSFVNLSYVIRVFKETPTNITLEFHTGKSPYEFLNKADADETLNKIWNLVND